MAVSFGAEITVDIRDIFTVLENREEQARAVQEIATELLGPERWCTAIS
jgi:hypothetical protein